MLVKNPEKRITIKEILKTPIIVSEIEKIKNLFGCYKKQEDEKNHQISFQEYLNDKLQKTENSKENTQESNQYSSKSKDNVKILMRYTSLPAQSFEIYNEIKGTLEDNKVCFQFFFKNFILFKKNFLKIKKNKRCTTSKLKNGFNSEDSNKTSHFEEFLQSKRDDFKTQNLNKNFGQSPVSGFVVNLEKKFPFLKELNMNPKFIDSAFMNKQLEKDEFLEKIKENCCQPLDETTLNLIYEHYSKILKMDSFQ